MLVKILKNWPGGKAAGQARKPVSSADTRGWADATFPHGICGCPGTKEGRGVGLKSYSQGLCVIFLLAVAACQAPYLDDAAPRPGNPNTQNSASGTPPPAATNDKQAASVDEPTGVVSLRQALATALLKNPGLKKFSWEIRAAEARRIQAGHIPNPELEVEVEDVGGSAEQTGFQSAEITFVLKQEIELGWKQTNRISVAELESDIARWEYRRKRLDVLLETTKAFVDVMAAKRRLSLSERTFELTKQVHEAVTKRLKAGLVAPLEETKARVAVSIARIKLDRIRSELAASKKRLAGSWGSTVPAFSDVSGNFEQVSSLMPIERLKKRINMNPDLKQQATELDLRRSIIALKKSENIPDITLSFGVRRLRETDDNTFVFGFSIPLPLFGLNPGAVEEAEHNLEQSKVERQATGLRVRASLNESYPVMSSSYRQIVTLKSEVLPAAQQAFDATRRGYREGNVGLLDVLDAQRTLFEVQGQYIDALEAFHKSKAEVERLLGGSEGAPRNRQN